MPQRIANDAAEIAIAETFFLPIANSPSACEPRSLSISAYEQALFEQPKKRLPEQSRQAGFEQPAPPFRIRPGALRRT